jgi:hypothetical protein
MLWSWKSTFESAAPALGGPEIHPEKLLAICSLTPYAKGHADQRVLANGPLLVPARRAAELPRGGNGERQCLAVAIVVRSVDPGVLRRPGNAPKRRAWPRLTLAAVAPAPRAPGPPRRRERRAVAMATAWPPSCSLDPDALRRLITRPYYGAWPRTAVWRGQPGRASLLNVILSASPRGRPESAHVLSCARKNALKSRFCENEKHGQNWEKLLIAGTPRAPSRSSFWSKIGSITWRTATRNRGYCHALGNS